MKNTKLTNRHPEAFTGETTVIGWLSTIDLNAQTFSIQPKIETWPTVRVNFESQQWNLVTQNLDQLVAITGEGNFLPDQPLPEEMNLESLGVITKTTKGPSLSEMWGYWRQPASI